jgi:hypothetical protein
MVALYVRELYALTHLFQLFKLRNQHLYRLAVFSPGYESDGRAGLFTVRYAEQDCGHNSLALGIDNHINGSYLQLR